MEELTGLSIDGWPLIAVTVFVALDIVTGLIKSGMVGEWSSGVMREGLAHKCTYYLLIVVFTAVEVFQHHFDVLPDVPTALAVCVYVIGIEFISVIENPVAINPELSDFAPIKKLFGGEK